MDKTEIDRVDTRRLKSGQYRLRFRLSEQVHAIATGALSLTPYDNTGASLDAIAINSLAGSPAVAPLRIPASGSKRLLVRLFPDQYEAVRDALDFTGQQTDADALLMICARFINEHSKK